MTFDSRRYESSGEYEIMVSLNNAQHCDYGIQTMTTVMLDDGQSMDMQHTGNAGDATAMNHTGDMGDSGTEQEEEIELGRLVVQPR